MKTETRYICEVCGKKYTSDAQAVECEAKPMGDTLRALWPVGMLLNHREDWLTLCVAKVETYNFDAHCLTLSFWACRERYVGDSLGDELCGGDIVSGRPTDYFIMKPADFDTVHAKRLIAYLRSQNITPTYWNGTEIVPVL